MIRKNIWTSALIGILSVVLTAPVGVFAQPAPNAQSGGAPQNFSQAQLDQMLAPIALYPDSLLAQILLASTYPSQVVEADRWVKAHQDWSKDRINAALDKRDWDLSVKALVPFPKVLAMMDNQIDWTTNLGEAFLSQQPDVMAQVQDLRHRAYSKGNLNTTEQQKVVVSNNAIEIQPVDPQVVYVPYYDPSVIYGNWWWPGYPPYAFFPYAGPYITYGLFGFAAGIAVGAFWNWGWGHWGWGDRNVYVNVNRHLNINDPRGRFHRGDFRTANFHQFSRNHVAGLGTVRGAGGHGAHAGAFNRPSAASVQRGLSRNRAGAAHGFTGHGHGFAADRGSAAGVHGHGFAGGARNHGVNGAGNFRGHGFAGSNAGHPHPGFNGGGGFRGSVGGAHHFGGASHFGGGGFRGGAAHFGGGGGHFGGGGGHGGGHR
ncbi:MAG: DUF3300 domain-containing protein [Syntrophobacteraceae bacterium]|nr:DUF3300 domain-containing protein [Syntrophobacteraceae bacterium]